MNLDIVIDIGAIGAALVLSHWALLKMAASQFEKRLDDKFAAQEKARQEASKALEARLAKIEERYYQLDREVREILITMPEKFTKREDSVRRETILDAKMDQLSLRIQNWILENRNA